MWVCVVTVCLDLGLGAGGIRIRLCVCRLGLGWAWVHHAFTAPQDTCRQSQHQTSSGGQVGADAQCTQCECLGLDER